MQQKSGGYKWVMMLIICLGIIVPQYAQFMLTRWGDTWLTARNLDSTRLAALLTAPLIPGAVLIRSLRKLKKM